MEEIEALQQRLADITEMAEKEKYMCNQLTEESARVTHDNAILQEELTRIRSELIEASKGDESAKLLELLPNSDNYRILQTPRCL
ncbi:unnamed protein product [Protopolystoma xenopodis]|uniref:Uncharacterized protein n=1 Tax=Protopolystoma xenopodis TaxID=117903 RepID=A0A3S5A5R2_9PLAT|nr:unnamed protein product [Protopolystoma xenopodis]